MGSVKLRNTAVENNEKIIEFLKEHKLKYKVEQTCNADSPAKANMIKSALLREALFKIRGTKKPPSTNNTTKENYWTEEIDKATDELTKLYNSLPQMGVRGRRTSAEWQKYTRKRDEKNRLERAARKKFKRDRAKKYNKWKK